MPSLPPKLPKKKRRELQVRCPAHRNWVRQHACSVPNCEGQPIEAAHVRIGGNAGTGLKPGDDRVISLCATHHRLSHQVGERTFAERFQIDLETLAATFWRQSPAARRYEAKNRSAA